MKIGVVGCKGRVGTLLVQELLSGTWEAELAGGTVLPQDLDPKSPFFITDNPDELFERADAVIDFTSPAATRKHVWLAAKHSTTLIVATSGLTANDEREIDDASKETRILYSANMSLGVNLLIALTEKAAERLSAEDWDSEILDLHHKHKVDAPSGTSYALARAVLKGRGEDETESSFDYARHGYTGERKSGAIGFSVQRGGDIVAENSSIFFGAGERLELTHRATDRGIFARGAIQAALWAHKQPNGLYSIRDMLGL